MTEVDRTEKKMEGNKVNYNDRRKKPCGRNFRERKAFCREELIKSSGGAKTVCPEHI